MALRHTQLFEDADRQQAYADALMQRAAQSHAPVQQGRITPTMGIGHGLTQLAEGLLAGATRNRAASTREQADEARQQAMANALAGLSAEPAENPFQSAQSALSAGVDPSVVQGYMRQQFPAQMNEARDPASIQEYNLAVNQGYDKSFQEWIRERNQRFNVVEYGGQKYMVDNTGVSPPRLLSSAQDETAAAAERELVTGQAGKGFVLQPEGGFAPAPGTAAAREAEQLAAADESRRAGAVQTADIVSQDIDRALGLLDSGVLPKSGAGSVLSVIPGTGARDLAALVDTVKSNIGFDELQAMREASPTGGALGAISEREINFLQSLAGNLELSQSRQQLTDNLNRLWNAQQDTIHGPGNGPPRRRLSFEQDDAEVDALVQKYLGAGGG